MSVLLLGTFNVAAFGGINANAVAFVNKGRHGHDNSIFKRRWFVYVGNCCALHCWFSASDGQFHRSWQINPNGRPFEKFSLYFQSRRQPLVRITKIFAAQSDLLEILCVHEMMM